MGAKINKMHNQKELSVKEALKILQDMSINGNSVSLEEAYDIFSEYKKRWKSKEEFINELNRVKKENPTAFVPKIDSNSGLPVLPNSEYGDWEY